MKCCRITPSLSIESSDLTTNESKTYFPSLSYDQMCVDTCIALKSERKAEIKVAKLSECFEKLKDFKIIARDVRCLREGSC